MKYKVMIDYKNFIPIDDSELEKAMRAMAADGKAFFQQGATERIHAILPDFHAIMGWNYGYDFLPEDYATIAQSVECNKAKQLIYETKEKIAGREVPLELHGEIKRIGIEKRVV